jgi:glycosyltransferase involved in cell wall biosynthesis
MNAKTARLLVILPAYNEAKTVGRVIRDIPRQVHHIDEISILVVDDGSTDGTAETARAAGAEVVSHDRNMGVGAAIITGLREALARKVDFAVNMDADGQFDPAAIHQLIRPLVDGDAQFATASRFADPALVPKMPLVKRLGNAAMSRLVSRIAGRRFFDVSCGFRAYSRESLMRLFLHGKFTYTQEMILALSFAGVPIVEVPVKVRGVREHGKSKVANNLFVYAYKTLGIIFSCVRDYRPSMVFNAMTFALLALAIGLGGFFVWHRLATGSFSPHLWAGFTSAFLWGLGFLTFVMSQLALMLSRLRLLHEEQLYLARRQAHRDV